jgi:hypothetical protein
MSKLWSTCSSNLDRFQLNWHIFVNFLRGGYKTFSKQTTCELCIKYDIIFYKRDFYFCALRSLVVLSYPEPLNFSQFSPPSSLKPLADARTGGLPSGQRPWPLPVMAREPRWLWIDRCFWMVLTGRVRRHVEAAIHLSLTCGWYVSNVSIIFDAPCLFLHHLPIVSLHFMALLCIFQN